jgi:hypothetical protein
LRQPPVGIVVVLRLLILRVGAAGDMVRAIVNIADGAVFRVGGAGQIVAAPGEGPGQSLRCGKRADCPLVCVQK